MATMKKRVVEPGARASRTSGTQIANTGTAKKVAPAASLLKSAAPVTRGEQLENRCQKFVEVAEQLFLERGFAGTSVNEVVRRAGGSLATLYSQYGNKEVLFEAVMNRRSAVLFDGIFPDADERKARDSDVAGELLLLARRLQTHMFSPSALGVFRLAVHEGPKFPSVRNAVLNNGLQVFLKRLSGYLASLKDRVEIDDPDRAAEEFLTLIQGQQRLIAACGELERLSKKQREDHIKRAVEIFLRVYPVLPAAKPHAR